ncbi:MAG TPA: mechanosensitive ion channel protein [Eubacterium sp.]|nr:mechanosensitive ion channel protein [Eubacterium sp.]HAX58893.1 mechanosensitive ion channel protein [Eubacterium sp.]HAZ87391.1 mechanosensitive ion channel protein [Eubacterium sp.]
MDAVAKSVSHWDKVLDTVIEYAIRFGKNILIALIVYFIASRLIKWVLKLTTKALNKGKIEPIVVKFIYSIIKVGLYVLLFIAIVSILGIPTTTFVTLFGTVTLSVGLALQGSLANFAGGVLILIFKPFKVGDYIVACGDEGTVVGIDVFYTKLATVDNKMIVIPNGTLANSSVKNVSAMDIRRVDVQVGISYESDITAAKKVLMGIIDKNDNILRDKPVNVFVASLDASQVTLETRVWVSADKYWDTKWAFTEQYKLALDEAGIEIPFNQLSVTIKNTQGQQ